MAGTNVLSFFFSSRRRHTRSLRDLTSDVCSSDLASFPALGIIRGIHQDRRKLVELGDSYRTLMSQTSFIPGGALISGRQRLSASDIPWTAILEIGRASCRERAYTSVVGESLNKTI